MDKLSRVQQKVFGETGNTSQFAEIGSQAAGTPTKTKDLATIQSLSQYLSGLYAITDNAAQPPFIEELNSLFLLITSQLAYYFQNGFPEYDPNTDYFNLVSFVQVNGVVYQSINGTDGATNKGNTPAVSPTKWRNVDPYTVKSYFDYAKTQLNTGTGVTGSDLYNVAKKAAIETKYEVGSVHELLYHKAPVVWDPTSKATVDAYNPCIDLAAIADYQVIDSTGTSSGLTSQPIAKIVAPDFVSWLRAFKITARRGMATEKSAFALSTWAVSGGTTATLVFASDADLVAALTAWGEDALVAGASDDLMTYTPDYTKSALLNIPSTLSSGGSSIPAGDYVLTSNNPATREVQFTIPATSNISATATSVQCSFYPFRLVGETGKARIFASQGRVLQGANDGLAENFSGFRRRGRIKGHQHSLIGEIKNSSGVLGAGDRIARGVGDTASGLTDFYLAKNIGPDASNGPVVVGPETDSRSTIVHFHVGIGSLEV